jgi:hypothetical protein
MKTFVAAVIFVAAIGCGGESPLPNPSTHNTSTTPEVGNQSDGMPLANCQNPVPDCLCCYQRAYFQTSCTCNTSVSCDQSCSEIECWPYVCTGDGCVGVVQPGGGVDGTLCYDINDYTVPGACCQ